MQHHEDAAPLGSQPPAVMPSTPPLVSVVMPSYNAAATIESSILSVLSQTVADLELIVVDDGSSDDSVAIVERLAATDQRIMTIRQQNAGPSAARNRAVGIARGRLLAMLDSDDLWSPDHLARHSAALAADATLGVSFSPCACIDSAGRPTGERSIVHTSDLTIAEVLAGNPATTCSSMVIRREVFDDVGLMRDDMSFAEDQEWLFRTVISRWKVRGIATYTVEYRRSPAGLSTNTHKMLAGWMAFLDHARARAPGVIEPYIARATWQMGLYHTRVAVRCGQPAHVVRGHFLRGLRASPASAARSPLKTLAFAGACLSPRVARRAMGLAKGLPMSKGVQHG